MLSDGRVAFVDFGMTKTISRSAVDAQLGVLRAGLESNSAAVHDGLAAVGFFDGTDARFEPERLLAHVRALNAWYAHDRDFTVTPEYVSKLMVDAGDPRSQYWDMMRHGTMPPEALLANRMQGMTLALLGQLEARANWHRIMNEWLYGSPPASSIGQAEAEFFGTRSQDVGLARGLTAFGGGRRLGT